LNHVSLQVTKCLVDFEGEKNKTKNQKKYSENYFLSVICEVLKGFKMAKARC